MKNTGLKKLAAAVMAAAMLVIPVVAYASFGPSRPTKPYDPNKPGFDNVTFNSYTGTPYAGDERNFLTGQSTTGTTANGWKDPLVVADKGEYYLKVYIHNGADPSLNSNSGQTGVATGTTVKVELPATTNKQAKATIHADNASPKDVYDTLDINSSGTLNLAYVPGSAMLYSHGAPNGTKLSDSIVNGGTMVGSEKLDGKWLGCFQYMGFVYLKVRTSAPAQAPSLSIAKTVEKPGGAQSATSMTVAPGDKVEYGLTVKNTGKTDLQNVVVRDAMPAGMTVTGATLSKDGGAAQAITNYKELFNSEGVNIGALKAGSTAVILVQATVNADATGADCSINLPNTAYASATGVPAQSAKATVQVNKTCSTPSTPAQPLPETGAGGAAAGALGLTAIGTSLRGYLRSKRGLLAAARKTSNR